MTLLTVCAWCGETIKEGDHEQPPSHGICATCTLKIRDGLRKPDLCRPRWVVVIPPDRSDVYRGLQRNFDTVAWVEGVEAVVDRRVGERRRRALRVAVDQRRSDRRTTSGNGARSPAYRSAFQGDGFEVYEASG